jgi:SAM-dependent methyltransferase
MSQPPVDPSSVYAAPRKGLRLEDCQFYHTMEVPGVGEIKGFGNGNWDLRQCIPQMLGDIQYAGKRILEVGPASGHLTFEMERRGGQVVAVDAPYGHDWDVVPFPGTQQMWKEGCKAGWAPQTNAWWFAHERFQSKAQMVYASATQICDVPMGDFDVSIMANMLLHNRDHMKILENCAKITKDKVVIVEQWQPDLEPCGLPIICYYPTAGNPDNWNVWWRFTTAYFKTQLEIMGFKDFQITRYTAPWNYIPFEMFTMVASR